MYRIHFLLTLLWCTATADDNYLSSNLPLSSSRSSEASEEKMLLISSPTLRKGSTSYDDILKFRASRESETLVGQNLINFVNRNQNLWKAKLNSKFASYDDDVKFKLMGVNHVHNSANARKKLGKSRFLNINLPKNFDSRTNWPECDSIKAIRDQSSCGSCWAFGAVEAISDRICIASGGKTQVTISADDLLSCCSSCGFGCNGGEPIEAWHFWVKHGLVTGSNYTLHQGCKPYPFPPCEHHSLRRHYQPCKHELYPTPKCKRGCQGSFRDKDYNQDKHYGRMAYAVEDDVNAIQNELFTNGPLEISFEVYDDFLYYQQGIYIHQGGKLQGGHAVKLVGWGEEGDVPYWLVANSWNVDWGENGFFRIIRGKNECGIESGAVAGIPDLSKKYSENIYDKM